MWQPATLLTLTLCLLLLRPLVGFPHARQALAKSARGDDLISGSDFLSVFIGATVPRSRSAIRRRPDSVTSEESNERYTDTEFDSESQSYSTSNDPQNTGLEASSDSSSLMPELENSHVDSRQDIGSKELATVSTNLANDLDSINNAETQKSAPPNDFLAQNADVEPVGESSITSSRRIEYISDIDIGKSDDKHDISQKIQTSTLSPPRNSSAPTLDIESISSTFLINSDPDIVDPVSSSENKKLAEPGNPDYIEDATASPDLIPGTESLEESSKQSQNETHQVISVRVSSSVARASPQHANKNDDEKKEDIFTTFLDAFAANAEGKELEGISLVTEEQPAATAIQRSQLSVEESSPSSVISVRQESSSSNVQSVRGSVTIESPLNLQSPPVSYHTSVSTATSGSRVQFFSEPPSYQRAPSPAAGTAQSAVVSQPQQHQSFSQTVSVFKQPGTGSSSSYDSNQQSSYQSLKNQGLNAQNGEVYSAESSRTQKSYETSHEEPQERNYELPEHHYGAPERSYAKPEQNYEVDESVSVISNGRAHGVQYQSATTPAHVDDTGLRDFSTQPGESRDPDSKFGYVVEGRNFRKYRVEERTSDGFIVGEYGVVSHDDGSLRGVRYTADGTINPRLIHDALVKFLSL